MPVNDIKVKSCAPCGVQTFQKNHYFNGKLLVERDFVLEQNFQLGKAWLHNKLLHGVGTVCGLKVTQHPNPSCRDEFVVLKPGVALDCCGHEIIVEREIAIPILELIEQLELSFPGDASLDLMIALCYQEYYTEKIPVILPDCDCDDQQENYNRIREGYEFKLMARPAAEGRAVRPPSKAKLDWLTTLTYPNQDVRAIAVDTQFQQIYVALQARPEESPEEEEAELGARLLVHRSDNHDLVTAVHGSRNPSDLAVSLLGDLIFLAADGLTTADYDDTTGIAIFREADIRDDTPLSPTLPTNGPVRLLVSPVTGDLFALELENQRLLRWLIGDLRDWLRAYQDDTTVPSPAPNALAINGAFLSNNGANIMSLTPNGRYLFIAQPDGQRIRVVDVADFSLIALETRLDNTDATESGGIPIAMSTSADSEYLHVLWQKDSNAIFTRYALETDGTFNLRREGLRGIWEATAHDLALSADERWAYVLQTADEQGRVQSLNMGEIVRAGAGDAAINELLGNSEDVFGSLQFQRLVSLNRRLYIASNDDNINRQPQRGLVAVIDVREDACADKFLEVVDGCPSCEGETDEHCVIIAHVPNYRLGEPILDATIVDDSAGRDEESPNELNIIDNFTYRHIVPSAAQIYEVIRCLLDSGFAEGIPGPRGAAGEQGLTGASAELRVTETHVQWRQDDDSPTWENLIALEDLKGEKGDTGPAGTNGAGVEMRITEDNVLQWRQIGSSRWITLIDLDTLEEPLSGIEAISWVHDNTFVNEDDRPIMLPDFLNSLIVREGDSERSLIVGFNVPIDPQTVLPDRREDYLRLNNLNEVVRLYIGFPSPRFGNSVYEEVQITNLLIDFGDFRDLPSQEQNTYQNPKDVPIINIKSFDNEGAPRAIRIRIRNEGTLLTGFLEQISNFRGDFYIFRIEVHCDFIRELETGQTINGNHINVQQEGQPRNNRAGSVFESWFYIAGQLG